ncbi:hypothetical protein Ancab_001345 [Ancistrocladus abbreviatus]
MCFSLFKLKSNHKKDQQQSCPRTLPSRSRASTATQSNNPPNEFHSSTSINNFYNSSSRSSLSSNTTLSSLRDSLPENPLIYDSTQIRSATNNFRLEPFHSSYFSTSWKCLLHHKDVIITRRKLRCPTDSSDLRRKLMLLCKSHHGSLVKLFGASVSGNYIYLVYEYVEGPNLSHCLRNPRNPHYTALSSWLSRVQIAADIAHGLDYMHNCSGVKLGFVHNHLKSSSIIVMEPALNAKLCYFGTAQLCGEVVEADDDGDGDGDGDGGESGIMDGEYSPKRVLRKIGSSKMKFEGTRGYMSPEFQSTGIPTLKSDVFAFGVVILELLTGEEPQKLSTDEEAGVIRKVSLIVTAREVVGGGEDGAWGRLRKWVDWRLRDSYPLEVVQSMVRLALECVQEDPEKRPDMNRVAAWVSKLYLESKTWAENFGPLTDITASFAPR